MATVGGTQPWGVPSSAQVSPHHSLTHTVSQIPAPPLCQLAQSAPNSGATPLGWHHALRASACPWLCRASTHSPALSQHQGLPAKCGSGCRGRGRGFAVELSGTQSVPLDGGRWPCFYYTCQINSPRACLFGVGGAVHIYATPAPLLYHEVPDRSPRPSLSALGVHPALLPGPT